MNVMVRYFSASGNTKKIAEAIVEGINVEAKSIIEEPVLTAYQLNILKIHNYYGLQNGSPF